MEHVLHLFGGGCGEHMVWPMIAASASGAAVWIRSLISKKRTKPQTQQERRNDNEAL
jgi:hypothetical protein